MRHADRARTNPACRQTEQTVIPLLALGAAIFTMLSSGVNAADLALPPRVVGQPQYGLAPSPAIPPPQVIIIPEPTAPPPYNGAMLPPPVVGSPPYGLAPRVAPRVYAERRSACPLAWRCGDRGCGWQPGCAPPLERYPDGPQVYSGPGGAPAPDQYPGEYELPDPQVYSSPGGAPTPDQYFGQYELLDPQVYSGPGGPSSRSLSRVVWSPGVLQSWWRTSSRPVSWPVRVARSPGVLRSGRPTSSGPVSQPVRFARSPGILPSWRRTSSTPVSRPVRVFWFGDVLRLPRPLTARPLSQPIRPTSASKSNWSLLG
jgi:hypothetical protein